MTATLDERASTETDEETVADAVVVAYVHSNEVTYSWHHSMVEMIGHDMVNQARIIRGGYIAYRAGTDGLVDCRNKAVRDFLADGKADWLFWLDTDMGFPADTLDRLAEAADPVDRPVVGALCFSQREATPDGLGGWRCKATPTVFDWATVDVHDVVTVDGKQQRVKVGEQQGFAVRWNYPINAVTKVAGTGSACILIHRSVFEKIAEKFGPVWYERLPNTSTGQLISEDLSLCVRAGALNIPVHVHTGVRTTHQKTLWLAEQDYWRQRALDPDPAAFERRGATGG